MDEWNRPTPVRRRLSLTQAARGKPIPTGRAQKHLKDHTRYDQGPEIHGEPRRVSLPVGEAQLAGCLLVQVGGPLECDAGIQ